MGGYRLILSNPVRSKAAGWPIASTRPRRRSGRQGSGKGGADVTPLGGRRKSMRSRSHNGPRGAVSAEDDERAASSLPGRTCIPTDLLRTFVAISEVGSFTKAAHLFGLT